MRSLASLDNADRRRRDQPDRVVSRERRIDRRRSAKTHVWPKRTHPLGGTVARYLGHICWTPTFRSGRHKPNPRIEEASGTLDDVPLAHLDLDHRIRRPGVPAGDE